MRYSSHATIEGAPRFDVRAQAEPIAITCGLEGAVRAGIGPIRARVGPVPVMVEIPFLGRVRRVAAVGPFDIRLDPVDVAIEQIELRCAGALGTEGLTVGLEGGIACKMEVDLIGKLPGRVARARLEFEEEGELEDEP